MNKRGLEVKSDKLKIGVSGPVTVDGAKKAMAERLFDAKSQSDLPFASLYFRIVDPGNCVIEPREVLFTEKSDPARFTDAQNIIDETIEDGAGLVLKFLGYVKTSAIPSAPRSSTREGIRETLST